MGVLKLSSAVFIWALIAALSACDVQTSPSVQASERALLAKLAAGSHGSDSKSTGLPAPINEHTVAEPRALSVVDCLPSITAPCQRPPSSEIGPNQHFDVVDLQLALLPPQPAWHPIADEGSAPTERRRIEIPKQASAIQTHLDKLQRRALELLPNLHYVGEVDWLAARGDHCVGFAVLADTTHSGNENQTERRVVLKQAGPFDAEKPNPLFLQERAWLLAMADQPRSPKLLAQCPKSSLLVMERVEGQTMPPLFFTAERRAWVADALATIHAVPLSPDLLQVRGEQRFPWSVERLLLFVHKSGLIDDVKYWRLSTLRDLIVNSLNQLPAVRTGIHGDAMPGNLLVDAAAEQVIPIDYEFASLGDPMYDLAFFAVSIHLPMRDALAMLKPYATAQERLGLQGDSSNEKRLSLYVTYVRLFRHVASQKEYGAGEEDQFDRWLYRLHEDVVHLQNSGLLQRSVFAPVTHSPLDTRPSH